MAGPLASLRVLDFSTLLPGPFASLLLADLGAEVLRVEAPHQPDPVRRVPPFDGDLSAWHALLHRSKRSLALDLKHPAAAGVVRHLVQHYDILLEQFRPGVMARLGIGYDALRAANPRLIYCAVTGYGQTGPLRDRAGHDNNYLALAGVMAHSGRRESGPPPLGVQVADIGGGSFGAVTGILAAVIQRTQTGEGQLVDISMLDAAIAWNSLAASAYLVGGNEPQREGSLLNGGSYYDFYPTADGRYLSVGSLEAKFWHAFCAALQRPDWLERGASSDPTTQQSLKEEIRQAIVARPLSDWVALFADLDACVEPVQTIQEMVEHPQTRARGMVVEVPKADGSSQRQIASPYKFSASTPTYRHVGVPPGAHTEEVLIALGYSEQDVAGLRADGLFGAK